MILWRPTNNNQRLIYGFFFLKFITIINISTLVLLHRYAFTPLLDAPDDDRDETELFIKDTYNGGIKYLLLHTCKDFFSMFIICSDVKMRTSTNTNHNSNVTPYKDYPASNSSTKSQTQLVCI